MLQGSDFMLGSSMICGLYFSEKSEKLGENS